MSGWTTKKLGEVCVLKNGYTPKKSDLVEDGAIPYYRISAMNLSGNEVFLRKPTGWLQGQWRTFKKGAIVFPKNGGAAYTGKLRILSCDSVVDLNTGVCLPGEEICNDYLYNWFQTLDLKSVIVEGTIPFIDFGKLSDVRLPIPPLAEQKRIVAKIDAAFAKIDRLKANAEKNLANAKELFQSALDEAMRPKKGWVEKQLGEVANIRVGPFGSSLHKADYVDNGVPLVNPCHMKDSKIADRISTQVSHDKAESLKEYRLKAGDIVFARRGEIGRLAFVSEKEDGYLCGTGSLFARFRERYDIQFLYFFFSSKSFVERLELLSTGTTMKSINSSALESMSFSVPLMNDQQRLAKQLDSLSQKTKALQQNYARQIADCAEMRQTILREAFEGRMRTRRDALRNLAGSWIDARATDEIAKDIERHRTAGRRVDL